MNLDNIPFNEITKEFTISHTYSVSEFIAVMKEKFSTEMEEAVKVLKILKDLRIIDPILDHQSLDHQSPQTTNYSRFVFIG